MADDPKGPLSLHDIKESLWQTPIDNFADTYKVNVAGALYTAVAFLDLLDKGNTAGNVQQASQVLVTSSIAGFHRNWPMIGLAYSTSKARTTHLVKSLASYLTPYRIQVNGIAPGCKFLDRPPELRGVNMLRSSSAVFPSEMSNALFRGKDMTVDGALPTSIVPLGRAGWEKEMAGTVLYYASPAGAYCSGSIHVIDGGRLGSLPGVTF